MAFSRQRSIYNHRDRHTHSKTPSFSGDDLSACRLACVSAATNTQRHKAVTPSSNSLLMTAHPHADKLDTGTSLTESVGVPVLGLDAGGPQQQAQQSYGQKRARPHVAVFLSELLWYLRSGG